MTHLRLLHALAAGPEAGIAAALQRQLEDRPDLASIVALLELDDDAGLRLTPAFLTAVRDEKGTSRLEDHGALLRAVFADPFLYRRPLLDRFTPSLARRIVELLAHHPTHPLSSGHAPREILPKGAYRHFNLDVPSVRGLLDALLPLLWDFALGRPVISPAEWLPGIDDPRVLQAFLPVLESRYLTPEHARTYALQGLSTPACDLFFACPIDPLNIRNLAVYAGQLLDGDRDGGRAQNRLPLQLAKRFGLTPRSIPDALALMDVLALLHARVLDVPNSDPLRLQGVFDQPVPQPDRFWKSAMAIHRARTLVTRGEQLESAGTFDSGLRFNTARATGLVTGAKARMADYAPYYAAIHLERLHRYCTSEWTALSPTHARRVDALVAEPGLVDPPIRLRDLGNILAMADLVPEEDLVLPAVARYALGATEYVPGASMQDGAPPRPRREAASTDNPKALVDLDKLCRRLDAAARPTFDPAASTASFVLLGVEVTAHVVEDGRRLVDAGAIEALLIATTTPDLASKVNLDELQRFAEWVRG